jgi:hypothetical protein
VKQKKYSLKEKNTGKLAYPYCDSGQELGVFAKIQR